MKRPPSTTVHFRSERSPRAARTLIEFAVLNGEVCHGMTKPEMIDLLKNEIGRLRKFLRDYERYGHSEKHGKFLRKLEAIGAPMSPDGRADLAWSKEHHTKVES